MNSGQYAEYCVETTTQALEGRCRQCTHTHNHVFVETYLTVLGVYTPDHALFIFLIIFLPLEYSALANVIIHHTLKV